MSIQLIARELYSLMRQIDDLEKAVAAASGSRKEALNERRRKLRAEYRRMRAVLDGQKDEQPSRGGFDR